MMSHWSNLGLNEREKLQYFHAKHYARNYAEAGIPGSTQVLLINKIAEIADDLQAKLHAAEEKIAKLEGTEPTLPSRDSTFW